MAIIPRTLKSGLQVYDVVIQQGSKQKWHRGIRGKRNAQRLETELKAKRDLERAPFKTDPTMDRRLGQADGMLVINAYPVLSALAAELDDLNRSLDYRNKVQILIDLLDKARHLPEHKFTFPDGKEWWANDNGEERIPRGAD